MTTTGSPSEKQVGRNEPCPCGSGKKFKRCCGKTESIDYSVSIKADAPRGMDPAALSQMAGMTGMDPSAMDPQMLAQVTNAMKRMPRGQMQRLQGLMQKAMSGKDVTRELEQFQATMPPDLQQMMASMAMSEGMLGQMGQAEGLEELSGDFTEEEALEAEGAEVGTDMDLEEARRIVEEAARSGKISEQEAARLLEGADASDEEAAASQESGQEDRDQEEAPRKKGGFWRKFSGRE